MFCFSLLGLCGMLYFVCHFFAMNLSCICLGQAQEARAGTAEVTSFLVFFFVLFLLLSLIKSLLYLSTLPHVFSIKFLLSLYL